VTAPSEASERELIAGFLGGDETVIGLVRSWVRSQVRSQLAGSPDRAEDLEQQVLLDLLEALDDGRFRGDSRFETYVRTFSRFKCIDLLRMRGRRSFVALEDVELATCEPSPLERIGRRQDAALARRIVEALPAGCRELWALLCAGRSYGEMSRLLCIPEGALRVRVHRCRQKALALRERLCGGKNV